MKLRDFLISAFFFSSLTPIVQGQLQPNDVGDSIVLWSRGFQVVETRLGSFPIGLSGSEAAAVSDDNSNSVAEVSASARAQKGTVSARSSVVWANPDEFGSASAGASSADVVTLSHPDLRNATVSVILTSPVTEGGVGIFGSASETGAEANVELHGIAGMSSLEENPPSPGFLFMDGSVGRATIFRDRIRFRSGPTGEFEISQDVSPRWTKWKVDVALDANGHGSFWTKLTMEVRADENGTALAENGDTSGSAGVDYPCGVRVTFAPLTAGLQVISAAGWDGTGCIDECEMVADSSGPWKDTTGAIRPFIVLRENETLGGSRMIGVPSLFGFNDAGQVALQTVQACAAAEAPGSNYLLRLSLSGGRPVKELSSFTPSPERTNIGLGLRDDGGVISFDSFDSVNNDDPPIVNGRTWQGDAFQLLPANLREVGEATAFGGGVEARGSSANGNFYLVAISRNGDRETILLNGQGTALQTFQGVLPSDPVRISDDGQFLGAPFADPGNIHAYQPNGLAIQVGNPVQHIRMSRDGSAIARIDKLSSETPSFVLQVINPSGAMSATVINPSVSDLLVDPMEAWRGTKNGVVEAAQIIGGVRDFLDVVAVQRLSKPLGDQIMTVIEAADTAGVAGLYYIRSSAGSGKVFASGKIPRIAGLNYPDTASHSAGSDAFLNRRGEILVQESIPVLNNEGGVTGKTTVYSIFHANTLTKFKQGAYGSLLTGLAANPATRWFDQPVNPGLPATSRKAMNAVGCTLTAMATIASFHGREITPLEVRDVMLSLGAIDKKNNTTVGMFKLTSGNKTLRRTEVGGSFADIVAELRGGHVVLLQVPNKNSSTVAAIKIGETAGGKDIMQELPPLPDGSYNSNGKGHFIVAYGLNPSLDPATEVTAADILISDPAYSYAGVYGSAYTAGEELVHVTLANFFARIAGDPKYDFDVVEWFDHDRFHRETGEIVRVADRTQIQRWRIEEGPLPPEPTVNVFSPVELAITANGKRYVSAPALAGAGDILLQKIGPDNIGAFDEVNDTGTGADEAFEEFPPYTLILPPELAGLSLDFEIHGIGTGSYKIVLNPSMAGLEAASFLAGDTIPGQITPGRIEVIAVADKFVDWAADFPALGTQNGFSDDPDGDGISNGLERFLGTHPLETSAGLTWTEGPSAAAFRHTRAKSPGTDAGAAYQWSTNLTDWHSSGETVAGITVTLTAAVVATGATTETVAVTPVSTGSPAAFFYRLQLQLIQ